jgi:hypothetical protein
MRKMKKIEVEAVPLTPQQDRTAQQRTNID